MGLKFNLKKGDKVLVGKELVVDVLTTSDNQTQLEFWAPKDLKIDAVFKDSSRMFKNRNKQPEDDDNRGNR